MVKDAYGVARKDLAIGAEILFRTTLSDEFADASGRYFDSDQGLHRRILMRWMPTRMRLLFE